MRIPDDRTPDASRQDTSFFGWGKVGCGGALGILLLLIVIGAIVSTVVPETASDAFPSPALVSTPIEKGKVDFLAESTQVPIPTQMPKPPSTPVAITSPTPNPTPESTSTPAPTATPTSTPIPTPTPTPRPTPVPLVFQLSALLIHYEDNKVYANSQFRFLQNGNRPLMVTGFVSEIEALYVSIAESASAPSYTDGLKCYYEDTREALHLSKGQQVTLTGRVRGVEYGDIVMYQCDILEVHLDKNPQYQAHQVRGSVVRVFCIPSESVSSLFFGLRQYQGTGIVVDNAEGIVLTAHHVVEDANGCERVEIEPLSGERRIVVTVEEHCASIDRGHLLIPAEARGLFIDQQVYFASAPPQVDQQAYFWAYGSEGLRLEEGIVESSFGEQFTLSAYAVAGDSGSPVFNEYGHLLGILTRSNFSDRAVFYGGEC